MESNLVPKKFYESKLFKSIFFGFLLQLFSLFTGFLIPSFFIRLFGSTNYGLLNSARNLSSYINLVDFGLSLNAVYLFFKPLTSKNSNDVKILYKNLQIKYSRIIKTSFLITFFLGIIFSIFYFYKLPYISPIQSFLIFFLSGLTIIIDAFYIGKEKAFLVACEKQYILSIYAIIQNLFYLIFCFFILRFFPSLVLLVLALLLSIFFKSFLVKNYINKNESILNNFSTLTKSEHQIDFSQSKYAFGSSVSGILQNTIPSIVIIFYMTLNDLSIFSIYLLIVNSVFMFFSLLSQPLSSRLAKIYNGENISLYSYFYKLEFILAFISIGFFSVTYNLFSPFISLYTSSFDINYSIPYLSIILTTTFFIKSITIPYYSLSSTLGLFKESFFRYLIVNSTLILFSLILVKFYGLIGISISLLISNLFSLIIFLFNLNKVKVLNFSNSLIKNFLFISCFFIFCYLLGFTFIFPFQSFLYWIFNASIVTIFSGLILIIIFFFFSRIKKY